MTPISITTCSTVALTDSVMISIFEEFLEVTDSDMASILTPGYHTVRPTETAMVGMLGTWLRMTTKMRRINIGKAACRRDGRINEALCSRGTADHIKCTKISVMGQGRSKSTWMMSMRMRVGSTLWAIGSSGITKIQ